MQQKGGEVKSYLEILGSLLYLTLGRLSRRREFTSIWFPFTWLYICLHDTPQNALCARVT